MVAKIKEAVRPDLALVEDGMSSHLPSEKLWRPGDRRLRLDQPMGSPAKVSTSSSESLGVSKASIRQSTGKE